MTPVTHAVCRGEEVLFTGSMEECVLRRVEIASELGFEEGELFVLANAVSEVAETPVAPEPDVEATDVDSGSQEAETVATTEQEG